MLKDKKQYMACAAGTIDQIGTVSSRPLLIAPDNNIDRTNSGAAEQLNPIYQAVFHLVVAEHRQHVDAATKP
ncbi:TPA: hypothetical protein ACSP3K_001566 [Aeromonas veronii]|uniref:hypothetical protein n=1 Tax=Aeromonas TaxID=642 RepID=UPI001F1D8A19|nr:hypothetical protein [Aeromonas veronii]MCF5866702.1 hypothetical protein [Aeromonas veronii]